jgi:hypothetical protein
VRNKVDGSQTSCPSGQSNCELSAYQVGVQTCTRLLAFREIQGDLHFSNLKNDSLLQVGEEDSRKTRPNATISARCLVTSLTITT